jgi:carbohydrate kinase (thermoresistant glucokinase family)
LKRAYRDRLRSACGDLLFVYLHGPQTLLQQRLQARQGHYMPASLLDSQLSTLEPPGADEQVLPLDIRMPVSDLIDAATAALERR